MTVNDFENMIDTVMQDIEKLRKEDIGCLYYTMDTNDKVNRWAIVIGFFPGFTNNENDDDYYRICGEIAYQSKKSIMQCDADIDWIQPYNEKNGEVDDTNIQITSKDDLLWLAKEWTRIKAEHNL